MSIGNYYSSGIGIGNWYSSGIGIANWYWLVQMCHQLRSQVASCVLSLQLTKREYMLFFLTEKQAAKMRLVFPSSLVASGIRSWKHPILAVVACIILF